MLGWIRMTQSVTRDPALKDRGQEQALRRQELGVLLGLLEKLIQKWPVTGGEEEERGMF